MDKRIALWDNHEWNNEVLISYIDHVKIIHLVLRYSIIYLLHGKFTYIVIMQNYDYNAIFIVTSHFKHIDKMQN